MTRRPPFAARLRAALHVLRTGEVCALVGREGMTLYLGTSEAVVRSLPAADAHPPLYVVRRRIFTTVSGGAS